MLDFKLINVGIADCKTASAPDILRTILGSCVGICLYDPVCKIGALSHIMLPINKKTGSSLSKYADTAIPHMLEEMLKNGSRRDSIVAKIVGGATMFKLSDDSMMGLIGKNNVKKVREILAVMAIKIISEDVGGDYGRTIDFFADTGIVKIRSMGRAEISI